MTRELVEKVLSGYYLWKQVKRCMNPKYIGRKHHCFFFIIKTFSCLWNSLVVKFSLLWSKWVLQKQTLPRFHTLRGKNSWKFLEGKVLLAKFILGKKCWRLVLQKMFSSRQPSFQSVFVSVTLNLMISYFSPGFRQKKTLMVLNCKSSCRQHQSLKNTLSEKEKFWQETFLKS